MSKETKAQMIEKLEAHGFPSIFVFKFIVPVAEVPQVMDILPEGDVSQRPSKTGKYTSITCKSPMDSAESTFAIYEEAAKIPGMISL